jgi:hypothetical protein
VTYWTFLVATDDKAPAGEYVYEVRLYPSARWVSRYRSDRGEPLVLKRGLLIATDKEEDGKPPSGAGS